MSDLLIHRHGPVLQLTLNRPQARNALNNALLTQIAEALEAAAVDDSVGVCVIRGNARFFAAGADLNEMAEKDLPATLDDIRPRLWVLSGESIDARQAQQAGLVSDIHPAALTDEYALKLATTIARHSPLALRAAKQSLRLSQEVSLQAGLQQERQLFSLLSATEDRREGIDAFLQKRTPEFKGR